MKVLRILFNKICDGSFKNVLSPLFKYIKQLAYIRILHLKLVLIIEQKIKPNEQGNFGDDRVIMLTNPAQGLIKSLLTN